MKLVIEMFSQVKLSFIYPLVYPYDISVMSLI